MASWFVDVGMDEPLRYSGTTSSNKIVTVKLISKYPYLTAVEINKESLAGYWGYTVKFSSTLKELLDSRKSNYILLTSVEGRYLTDKILLFFLHRPDKVNKGSSDSLRKSKEWPKEDSCCRKGRNFRLPIRN